jgi:hypothetical protein
VGRDLEDRKKKNLARARPKMLFLVVLHYKMRGRPAQARARPEPSPTRPVGWSWAGFFRPEITEIVFDPARPEKCSPLDPLFRFVLTLHLFLFEMAHKIVPIIIGFCSNSCSHLVRHLFVRDDIQTCSDIIISCSGYSNILF